MKREKITFSLECIKETLLCVLFLVLIVCVIKVTHTYCTPIERDKERDSLEKELIWKQIKSFEWDENHRGYYENAY